MVTCLVKTWRAYKSLQTCSFYHTTNTQTHTHTHTHIHTHKHTHTHTTNTGITGDGLVEWEERKQQISMLKRRGRFFSFDLKEESEDQCLTERKRVPDHWSVCYLVRFKLRRSVSDRFAYYYEFKGNLGRLKFRPFCERGSCEQLLRLVTIMVLWGKLRRVSLTTRLMLRTWDEPCATRWLLFVPIVLVKSAARILPLCDPRVYQVSAVIYLIVLGRLGI